MPGWLRLGALLSIASVLRAAEYDSASPESEIDAEGSLELRYVWLAMKTLAVDARIRGREELDWVNGAVQRRKEIDAFVRLTWRLSKEYSALLRIGGYNHRSHEL